MNFQQYFCLALSIGISCSSSVAQQLGLRNDLIVIEYGDTLKNAWAGGLNVPQFSPIDLDQDGKGDLLIFDRSDFSVIPFLNGGAMGEVDYNFAPNYIGHFPDSMKAYVLARDYDNDGKADLFTATSDHRMRVYRNVSSGSNLSFVKIKDRIKSVYSPGGSPLSMFSAFNDIPSITDIDDDGDLDILTFHVVGSVVEYHKNISIDSSWGSDSLNYVVQSSCFGHFSEDNASCFPYLEEPPCSTGMKAAFEKTVVHAGSTLLALDLNADGLKDLIVGDVGCTTLYALRNSGTIGIAHFDSVETDFPSLDVPVGIKVFPAAYYLDVNNDGTDDLIVAPNQLATSEDRRGVRYYENKGATNFPDFELRDNAFMQKNMIDWGKGTAPALFDYDKDGLLDLLVGNQGYKDTTSSSKTILALYRNTGTSLFPQFELVDDDYLQLSLMSFDNLTPAFADLDGDGDDDLILGEFGGQILLYEDIAAAGNPAQFNLVTSSLAGIDVGNHSAPHLADLDGDDDFDLLIGNSNGRIHYYENIGSPSTYAFDSITSNFGKIKITDFTGAQFSNGFAKPFVLDYDGDGKDELLVGTVEGQIAIFEDLSVTPDDSFPQTGNLLDKDFGSFASLAAAKMDGGSKELYFIGNLRGGLQLLGEIGPIGAETPETHACEILIYPNPSLGRFNIELEGIALSEGLQLEVYNTIGVLVFKQKLKSAKVEINLSSYPAGIYHLVIQGMQSIFSAKIIRIR